MVLFALINVSLDISTNVAWWLTKNAFYGTYYLITYIRPPKKSKEEIELMELKNEISILNKKLHFINSIQNNPNIITRNQLMLHDNSSIQEMNESFDLALIDDFVILNQQ
jgi:hypothetical protein